MSVSRSSPTTSLMPRVPNPTPSAIWGALTSLFTPRNTSHNEESEQTEPQGLPPFLSTQTPESSPSGVPPEAAAASFSSQPVEDSSPSEPVAGSSFSPPVAGSSASHPLTDPSPPQPVRCLFLSRAVAGKPEESRSSGVPQDLPPRAMSERPISQLKKELPPLIVRDFAYMPRPPLLDRPIDQRWVVDVVVPANAIPGIREREGQEWEASHSYLYRQGRNRADPPNTIAKTWGGLCKSEDDEMMRHAVARATQARKRTLALGLTPTEPNIGGPPPRTYSVMTEEELEACARIDASVQEQVRMAKLAGYGTPVPTPPNTPPPHEHVHAQTFPPGPSVPPVSHSSSRISPQSTRRSKRKREEIDNKHEDGKTASTSNGPSRKRRNQKQDADHIAKDTDIPTHYILRRRGPSSSSQTSNTKPSATDKGKGKARAP